MSAHVTLAAVSAVLLALGTARPAGAADPGPLLDAWANALGGRDKLTALQTYRTSTAVKMFGLDGTIQEWVDASGRHRLELDLGGMIHVEQRYDGKEAWGVDQNGKVARMTGQELEGELTSVYDATFSCLVPGRMKGTVEALGKDKDGKLDMLAITPEGGRRTTWYLDPQTHLPVRSERPEAERVQTTELTDWKEFGGVLFPTHQRTSTGDPKYEVAATLQELQAGVPVDDALFAKPQESVNDVRFSQGNEVRDIPLEFNTVHIFLQANLQGKPLWFVLDSGAGSTVVNAVTARELGLEMAGSIEGRGAGEGSVDVQLIKNVSVEVKGATSTATVDGQTVAAIDLTPVETLMGRQVDGILGYDFISRFVMTIDYHGARLHLRDRHGYEYKGSGKVVPLRLQDKLPQVHLTVTVPGVAPLDGEVLVDTGAGAVLGFARPFHQAHGLTDHLKKSVSFEGGFGVGGVSRSVLARIDAIDLGGLSFARPVCGFSQDEKGAGADPNRAGLIGGELLRRCTVIFDYERERMVLEPNADFGSPFTMDGLGIVWTTGGRGKWHEFTVRALLPGAPADKAGVKVGDRLVSLDGISLQQLTTHKLWGMFREDRRKVHLVLEREGKQHDLKLETKALL